VLYLNSNLESFTDTNVVNSVVVDFSIETLARTLDPPLIAEFQHLTVRISPFYVFFQCNVMGILNNFAVFELRIELLIARTTDEHAMLCYA
jgi:hypothetical protein